MNRTPDLNEYSTAEHALKYLARADGIPHRTEGEGVLLDFIPRSIKRILDLGSGDGRLLALVRLDRPDAKGIALDFSPTMLNALRDRFRITGPNAGGPRQLAIWTSFVARVGQFCRWPPDTPMIHNRFLPLWLHRVCNGLFGAVLFIGVGSIWFGEPPESWRHLVSRCLIWASIPVGIILALVARRFSIVQGVAGGDGYDELHEKDDKKPSA